MSNSTTITITHEKAIMKPATDKANYLPISDEYVQVSTDSDLVLVEYMPDFLKSSHRAAGNWGEHPFNGSIREKKTRVDAEEIIESDEDGYARVIEENAK